MLPSPRANSSVNWLEVIVKTTIVFGLGWFLVSNMLTLSRRVEMPPELKAADKALKAKNVVAARTQFDQLISKSHGSTATYRDIFMTCGIYQRADLLDAYAQQAELACKNAPKADQAEMYRELADAYLECGDKFAAQALQVAQKAFDLQPDSIESMNMLAYTIAETTTDTARLKQAQDLILHALTDLDSKTAVPDRPALQLAFNDTYAWVLYKQGIYGPAAEAPDRFARAANLLIDVVAVLPDDVRDTVASDIYYHLGAVYHKTGQIAQARNMLDIALQDNPDNAAAAKELASLPAAAASPAVPSQVTPQGKAESEGQSGSAAAFTPLAPPPAKTKAK